MGRETLEIQHLDVKTWCAGTGDALSCTSVACSSDIGTDPTVIWVVARVHNLKCGSQVTTLITNSCLLVLL